MHFDEYPPELVRAVGLVVMSAAWTEDKAGELVQLMHSLANKDADEPAKGWAASGQQLIEAFKKVVAFDLADRLRRVLEFRNEVIHGVFIRGDALPLWGGETGPEWVSMKRRFGKKGPASIATVPWSVAGLLGLAQEFSELERLIDDEISYAMGLKPRPTGKASGQLASVTDEQKVDRLVRWSRAELAWGQANVNVHGLGEELKNLTPADPDRADDDEKDYLISATEEKFADAVARVNDWLADSPQGAATAPAHGFQRALSLPLRGPGGSHESLSDEDDD